MFDKNNISICVIGAGSWGTTLAKHLAEKEYQVALWTKEEEVKRSIEKTRENSLYLPGIKLPSSIRPTNDIKEALTDKKFILFSVPSQYIRKILTEAAPSISRDALILNTAKGIEFPDVKFMHEVFADMLSDDIAQRYATLSGPSFAKEVAHRKPTAVVIASKNEEVTAIWQDILSSDYLGIHASQDVMGLEVAGSLKNIVAIAVGMANGLNLGHNAQATIITRGLNEIASIGAQMGADSATFLRLAGVGDLTLTCTGKLSRNREVGVRIGRGEKIQDIISQMRQVAEGVQTSLAAKELMRKFGVTMPITEQVFLVLHEGKSPYYAMTELICEQITHQQ